MDDVIDYIENSSDQHQREILLALYELFMAYPGMSAKVRYRIPFYYRKTWICYTNPIKNSGVELCFVRANELSDDQNLLFFGTRAQVGGISIFDPKAIPLAQIDVLLQEALELDDKVPYASKRKQR